MKITGEFRGLKETLYKVEINNPTVNREDLTIESSLLITDGDLYFSDKAVEVEEGFDDMFETIGAGSAKINLLTKDYVGHLIYSSEARAVTVKIWREDKLIFDGFVEAGSFNQPFSEPYDPFTVNCISKLSTLHYYKYLDIRPSNIKEKLALVGEKSVKEIILGMLQPLLADGGHVYYDMSKGVTSASTETLLDDVKLSEATFVGENYDDVMSCDEVMDEILKYLNLRIVQKESDFYIFDWNKIKNGDEGLPEGYTQAESIELDTCSTSDALNIDLRYFPLGRQEVTITMNITQPTEYYTSLWGSETNYMNIRSGSSTKNVNYIIDGTLIVDSSYGGTDYNLFGQKADIRIRYNGVSIKAHDSSTWRDLFAVRTGSSGATSSTTAMIFRHNTSNIANSMGKLYEITVKDIITGQIQHDFVPATNASGYKGLYDKTTDTWCPVELSKQSYFKMNVAGGKTLTWFDIVNAEEVSKSSADMLLNAETNADTTTSITIDEVYSQVKVTCETNSNTTLIENPLDSSSLRSVFSNRQIFMTEYYADGEGDDAYDAFADIVKGRKSNYDSAYKVDWYLQWLQNPAWRFSSQNATDVTSLYEKVGNTYINQYKISDLIRNTNIQGAIISIGKAEYEGGRITNDSPITKIDMQPSLVIGLNGNGLRDTNSLPSDSMIEGRNPVAEYIGTNTGGFYSPNDDSTTNYIVFSGNIFLVPRQQDTGDGWTDVYTHVDDSRDYHKWFWHDTVPSDNNDDGRYYTRKFYKLTTPNSDPSTAETADTGFMPPTEVSKNRMLEFNYSEAWNNNDIISNLDILECELIIGTKRLIQMDYASGSTLQWVTVGEEPTATYDGVSYTVTSFKLGINPKIDDFIIGQTHPIRSNMSFTANLNTDGFCIPIKKSDNVHGQVRFKILGPVNSTWDQITRRHPSFWRHTRWTTTSYPILAQAESVVITDFKCELMSDNAGVNLNYQDITKDIVYVSNEGNGSVNIYEEDFRIMTQLSTQEALQIGCSTAYNYNAAMVGDNYLSEIWSNGQTDKPEKLYVDEMYSQYSTPKIHVDTKIWYDGNQDLFGNYRYNALGRDFSCLKRKINLSEEKIELALRER